MAFKIAITIPAKYILSLYPFQYKSILVIMHFHAAYKIYNYFHDMLKLNSSPSDIFYQCCTAALYFLIAVLALNFAVTQDNTILFWPSSGFALAVLIKFGSRYAVGVFFGAMLSALYAGNPFIIVIGSALGNTLEPLIAIYLLKQLSFSSTIYNASNFLSLIIGSGLSAVVNALLAASSLLLAGAIQTQDFLSSSIHWWMADTLGLLLLSPFLLLFNLNNFLKLIRTHYVESSALLAVTLFSACLALTDWQISWLNNLPVGYFLIIALVWSALRFSQVITSLIIFIYFTIALWGLFQNQGMFIHPLSLEPNIELLWLYFVALSITSLLMTYSVNEKNTLYQAINNNKTEIYIFCEGTLNFEFVNQSALNNLGISLDEVLHLTPLDIKPLFSPEQFNELLKPLINNDVSVLKFETIHQRMDGSVYPVDITIQPVNNADRRCYVASAIDITERQEKEMHRTLGNHVCELSLQAIMITDEENNIIRINSTFSQVTGYSTEDLLGKNPSIFRSGHHGKTFYRQLWDALKSKDHWQGEIYNRRKNGELYLQNLTIKVLRTAMGEVQNYIAMFTDITQDREHTLKLTHLAEHDVLTGLVNKIKLQRDFDSSIALAKRNRNQLAVLFFDLNQFKSINESYGHTYGDEVLQTIADRIKQTVRETDIAARVGGDEFVVLMTNIDSDTASQTLINKLQAVISETISINDINLVITASIGKAEYPDQGHDLDTLLKIARTEADKTKPAAEH